MEGRKENRCIAPFVQGGGGGEAESGGLISLTEGRKTKIGVPKAEQVSIINKF